MEFISLIIPTRNEGENVRKTIDSLIENTFYPNFEVLILDDASGDGSCDFLSLSPYSTDQRLRLIPGRDKKRTLGRYLEAPQLARGSIFKFLDAHHNFSPYWLTNLYDRLRKHNFQVIIGPVVSALEPEKWKSTEAVSYGWGIDSTLSHSWHLQRNDVYPGGRVDWFSAHQILIPRDFYDQIGGFCPLFRSHGTDDMELCLRAYLFGYDCFVEPTALISHLFKSETMNPVSWADVMCNYFIMVFIILGEVGFEKLKVSKENQFGFQGGLELFTGLRPEVEEFRRWVVNNQSRNGEELIARLVDPIELAVIEN